MKQKQALDNYPIDLENVLISGYGEAPHIVYSLAENVSLKKKTVIPFSTSISSGLGSSAENLKEKADISSKTNWMEGRNFFDVPSQKTVNKWVKGLKY